MNNNPTLAQLIEEARKGGEVSYERLSQACGGYPTAKRLHQLQNGPIKTFPDPDTLRALSRGTGFGLGEIINACARSLNLNIASDDRDVLRIHGISEAPDQIVDLIKQLGREIASLSEARAGRDKEPAREPADYELAARGADQRIGHDQIPEET